jgi:hypothetical protein
MYRTTFAMVQNSRTPQLLNIPPGDVRLIQFVNEACERLLKRGKFWGTTSTYAVALTSQYFSLPPYLDTVEGISLGNAILPIHDMLYQYLQGGWGTRDQTSPNGSGVWEALQVGVFPTFVDVIPPGSTNAATTLTGKCDVAADVGSPMTILGYDGSTPPNWIRTLVGGVWQDGETILLSQGAGTSTLNSFSKITAIQIGVAGTPQSGQSWLYAGTVATGTLLSNFQWFESSPLYQRYQVPFLNSTVSTIQLVGKNAFIPVAKPTDYLSVGNLAAVKLACRAIKAEEESNWPEASLLWEGGTDPKTKQGIIGAVNEMDLELEHMLGSGRHIGIDIQGSGYGDDPVVALF